MRAVVPALLAVLLLFLPHPSLNPGGILALVPIFYFFVKNPKYMNFTVSLVLLMILDYDNDTTFIWSFVFVLFYVVSNFQKVIIFKEQKFSAAFFFFLFVFMGLFIQWFGMVWPGVLGWGDSLLMLLKVFWSALFTAAVYVPASVLMERIADDR
jgi:hypothetical protein